MKRRYQPEVNRSFGVEMGSNRCGCGAAGRGQVLRSVCVEKEAEGKRDGTVWEGESDRDRTERIRDYRIIEKGEKDK